MATKLVNGVRVTLTEEQEADYLSKKAAYDPTITLKRRLLGIERENIIDNMLTAKKVQIEGMDANSLRAAISAGGL